VSNLERHEFGRRARRIAPKIQQRANGVRLRADPSGHADQDVYLKALLATGSVDHIEYGTLRLACPCQIRRVIPAAAVRYA